MSDNQKNNNAWNRVDHLQAEAFAQQYISFLNQAKTEREATQYILDRAVSLGFKDLNQVESVNVGDKLLLTEKGKVAALLIMGRQPLQAGFNIVAAHLDSPRLDIKTQPLYEADNMALFKTHYYGGIKKYQWLAAPLAMHGVVIKKDGTSIALNIGEQTGDPVFTITDLLPHLAQEQMAKKLSEVFVGEDLNILVGSIPQGDEDAPIKQAIMSLLEDKYQIEQEDFFSAEIQMVPAFQAASVGLDASMVGGYGQDDRVCVYTSLKALLNIKNPERTVLALFVDKEEIGSTGNTGLQSLLMENLFAQVLYKANLKDYYTVRQAMAASHAISADVNGAIDPKYPEVFEKMNCSFLGGGIAISKATGSRGKYDASDANPEFIARIRALWDEMEVMWQAGNLGKVDIGGGGTVAKYMTYFGMEVVDCGVPVLGMHSPFEVTSKADVYMAYLAYRSFLSGFRG